MKSAHAACALVLALAAAVAVAACSSDPSTLPRSHVESGSGAAATSGGTTGSASVDGASTSSTPAPGTLPTASKAGEAFFAKELQPLLSMRRRRRASS